MNWLFGKKKEEMDEKFIHLKEETGEQFAHLNEEMAETKATIKELSAQMSKLTRFQFKSSKNIESKMDDIASNQKNTASQQDAMAQNLQLQHQQNETVDHLIRLLDEMDHVASGTKDAHWNNLLDQWTGTISKGLAELGVNELEVRNKAFNPEIAEALQTVAADSLTGLPTVPYEVVDILQRGFITTNGHVLRKAKVITVEGN